MKKIIKQVILATVMVMSVMVMVMNSSANPRTDVSIFINSKEQAVPSSMGEVFIDDQARTQVPLRFVSEKLGHSVDWDGTKQQVSIDDKFIILDIGDRNIKVNGKTLVMDTSPVTIKGRTYVPVRFIAEGLGHQVDYKNISGKNAIFITTSGEIPEQPIKKPVKNSVSENYNPQNVPTYAHAETDYGYSDITKHWVGGQPGSNSLNTKTRVPGTSFKDDLAYMNTIVGRTGYGFAGDGFLTVGGVDAHTKVSVGNRNFWLSINRNTKDPDKRFLVINGFVPKSNQNPQPCQVHQHNIIVESIKYLSKSIDDGLAIVAYISSYVDKDQYPPFNKVMTFGNTKVMFSGLSDIEWGFVLDIM